MTTYPLPQPPPDLAPFSFSRPVPSLTVSSIPSAIDYWTTCLPFTLRGRDGDAHSWISTYDGAVNIYLRRRGFTGPGRPDIEDDVAGRGRVAVRIALESAPGNAEVSEHKGEGAEGNGKRSTDAERAVKAVATALGARGAREVQGVRRMPWGHWTCGFEDLDGNVVTFYAEEAPV